MILQIQLNVAINAYLDGEYGGGGCDCSVLTGKPGMTTGSTPVEEEGLPPEEEPRTGLEEDATTTDEFLSITMALQSTGLQNKIYSIFASLLEW